MSDFRDCPICDASGIQIHFYPEKSSTVCCNCHGCGKLEKFQFREGQRVRKVGSYEAVGTIVAAFHTTRGDARYVFEFDVPRGMLHIFSEKNLIPEENPK